MRLSDSLTQGEAMAMQFGVCDIAVDSTDQFLANLPSLKATAA